MSEAVGVGEDPRVLEPDEPPEYKETIIKFDKVDDRATVFSEHRGVVSRLLRHTEAEPEAVTLEDGSTTDDAEHLDGTDTVVAYEGTVPVGALKVLKTPRDSARVSYVVSQDGGQ